MKRGRRGELSEEPPRCQHLSPPGTLGLVHAVFRSLFKEHQFWARYSVSPQIIFRRVPLCIPAAQIRHPGEGQRLATPSGPGQGTSTPPPPTPATEAGRRAVSGAQRALSLGRNLSLGSEGHCPRSGPAGPAPGKVKLAVSAKRGTEGRPQAARPARVLGTNSHGYGEIFIPRRGAPAVTEAGHAATSRAKSSER